MITTQIKVRVQAHGGKFLGPKVAPPALVVRVAGMTVNLFEGTFDNSASGTVVASPDPTASPNAILVPPPPTGASVFYPGAGAYFVEPPEDAAALVASFDLDAPAILEFIATTGSVSTSAMMAVYPGMQLLEDPGFILTFPGLLTSITSASYDGKNVSVEASVEMMCGCPITPNPTTAPADTEPYWPSYAFNVTAHVAGQQIPLACTAVNTFSGTGAVTLEKGSYDLTVVAEQPSATNVGIASGTVSAS